MRLLLAFCLAALGAAQEDHSQHQHPVAGLGTADLRTSCNAGAQPSISRGAASLHSFGYEEARIAFRAAAEADPACGMAYWGIARSWYHPIWPSPTEDELKEGAQAIARASATGAKTARELDYIASLSVFYKDWPSVDHATRAKNYEQALAEVANRYPDDDEAAIFHALQLVAIGYLDPADKSYVWQKRGSEILNRLLPSHPDHPGVAHYIIHADDYPALAELGLKAARAYAAIARDSPHALHMPSHIFTRLGLWDDSIASNIASAKSAVAQTGRLHGGGGSFDQLHAMDYLVYAYLQEARDRSAEVVLAEMDRMNRIDENQFAAAYALAAAPARWALERHDWRAAAHLKGLPAWFPWERFRNIEALHHYAKAIGAARAGDPAAARREADELALIRKGLPQTSDYDWSGSIGAQRETVLALITWAEGSKAQGIQMLRAAADREDSVDKHPVTPGPLLPAREILADLLMDAGSATAALKEYEAVLKTSPRRFNATAGAAQAAAKSGDRAKARAYAAELLGLASKAEGSRPELEWARAYLGRN